METERTNPLHSMSDDEKAAALRFCETCDDNEGYDVPRKMMLKLAAHGLVIDKLFGRFEQTDLLLDIRDDLEAWALVHNAERGRRPNGQFEKAEPERTTYPIPAFLRRQA